MPTDLIIHEAGNIRYRLAPLPSPTPRATALLNLPERIRHRARLLAIYKAGLRYYWLLPSDKILDHIEMKHVLRALEDWPVDQIDDAVHRWVCDNPNKRFNFGHIREILSRNRGDDFASRSDAEKVKLRQALQQYEKSVHSDGSDAGVILAKPSGSPDRAGETTLPYGRTGSLTSVQQITRSMSDIEAAETRSSSTKSHLCRSL